MISQDTFLSLLADAEDYASTREEIDVRNLNYYLRNPRGDEQPNQSTTVSSDCFDVVQSDMPSIVRALLGGGKAMEFTAANSSDRAQVIEAKQKTDIINRLILGQDWSFKVLYDWFLSAEINTVSAVTYYPRESVKTEVRVYNNVNKVELEQIMDTLEADSKIKSAEVIGDDIDSETERFDIEVEIERETMEYIVEYIDPSDFLISRGGPTLEDCAFVGHRTRFRKGELIEDGISKDVVEGLTATSSFHSSNSTGYSSSIGKELIADAVGSTTDAETYPEWYLEEVDVVIACVLGASKNGSLQRRRVMYAGNKIIKDEPFDHVNYAALSGYPLPNQVGGLSRVGITTRTQDEKTFVHRGMLNNMAYVNKPMTAIDVSKDGVAVNREDILNRRSGGVVRCQGNPALGIMPLPVISIAPDCLQLIQYLDFNRAQTTGSLMASQGLNRDDIYNETAARFNGVSEEGAAKLELVMRIYAETGIRKLYRGFEWMLKTYQSDILEVEILGEEIAYRPSDWMFDSGCRSNIGLAASDSSELLNNLGVVYSTQKELAAMGSTLVDSSKMYATLSKILSAMNVHDVESFYNDPSRPAQTVQAENEQMKRLVSQLQQQLEQSSVNSVLMENEKLKGQIEQMKTQAKTSIDALKLQEQAREFDITTRQQEAKRRSDNAIRITQLELEHNKNLEGGIDEQ